MFKNTPAFSSFSVDDLAKAKKFYGQVLGLDLTETREGLSLRLGNGGNVFIYPKSGHSPASFTVLNFSVGNVDETVERMTSQGMRFEHYDQKELKTDARGIARGNGPTIAWFRDPAGNILSVVEG